MGQGTPVAVTPWADLLRATKSGDLARKAPVNPVVDPFSQGHPDRLLIPRPTPAEPADA